jgi:hypothetical protein
MCCFSTACEIIKYMQAQNAARSTAEMLCQLLQTASRFMGCDILSTSMQPCQHLITSTCILQYVFESITRKYIGLTPPDHVYMPI